MASEYNLKLRATLDTSQVQQELQRLRQMQESAGGGGGGGGGGGSAASSVAGMDFRRLTQSIQSLDRQLGQLQRTFARQMAGPRSGSPTSSTVSAGGLPVAPSGPNRLSPQELEKQWRNSPAFRQANARAQAASAQNQLDALLRAARGQGGPSYGDVLNGAGRRYVDPARRDFADAEQQRFINSRQRLQDRANRAFMRGGARLLGGYVFGEIGGNLSRATDPMLQGIGQGMQTAGSAMQAAGGTTMALAQMGAGAAAGPVGIVVGVASAITSVIADVQAFADEVRKATEELEKHNEKLKEQSRTIEVAKEYAGHQRTADSLIDAKDLDTAKTKAAEWKKKFNDARDAFVNTKNVKEGEAVINQIAQDRVARLRDKYISDGVFGGALGSWNPYSDDIYKEAKNNVEKWRQEQIGKLHENYAAREKQMKEAKANYDAYENAADKLQREKDQEDREKAQEEARRQHEAERERIKAEMEQKRREMLGYRNEQAIAGYVAQGRANSVQDFANQTINDKAISPLEKFQRIADALDRARADKNSALGQAFEIAKYLKDNQGKLTSDEMEKKQKEQAKFDAQAAYAGQRAGILESALGEIKTQQMAPDISHVTSLAQYGFNMGEKDDAVERMEKYYTRSLNLQEQIKNKLQEGVATEAVYTE